MTIDTRALIANIADQHPGRIEVPIAALPSWSPRALLNAARAGLAEARAASSPGLRYATAHLAALRAAAAVIAARARPAPPTRREHGHSVWTILFMVAPELAEWSVFFAAYATRRAAAEAGIPGVDPDETDQFVDSVGTFVNAVSAMLGFGQDGARP